MKFVLFKTVIWNYYIYKLDNMNIVLTNINLWYITFQRKWTVLNYELKIIDLADN